jgi:hypothetical protein
VVRGGVTVVFVPWFALMGVFVVVTTTVGLDYRRRSWLVRAWINLGFVFGGLALTLAGKAALA